MNISTLDGDLLKIVSALVEFSAGGCPPLCLSHLQNRCDHIVRVNVCGDLLAVRFIPGVDEAYRFCHRAGSIICL